MNTSFYNGVAGAKTHQFGLNIWANNIANINTFGYKYKNPEFSTIFSQYLESQSFTPISNDMGLGASKLASAPVMSVGSLMPTNSESDMAIAGKGWFCVQDINKNYFYTRNGAFNLDGNGDLVDINGNYVLGKSANNINNGIITDDSIGDIKLNSVFDRGKIHLPEKLTLPAKRTKLVKFKGNLDSTIKYKIDENGKKVEVANKKTFRTILYGKDGKKRFLDVIFTKEVPQAPSSTKWYAKAIIKDLNGEIIKTKEGEFLFDSTGALVSKTLNSIENDGINVELDFGSTIKDNNTPLAGRDGLTSYRADIDNKSIIQNGYRKGSLTNYALDQRGNIQAIFDNGRSVAIYKVMVFNFKNEQGLNQLGSTYYQESPNSGKVLLLKDKDGNVARQNIKSRYLESSNVNLDTAMTELIVMQKAFDANAKSITTSDQLVQNAINMKK